MSQDCSCGVGLPDDGALASRMIAEVCASGVADANVGASTLVPGSAETQLIASVTCRDGASSNGQAACDAMADLVRLELGADFATATDYGGGCSAVTC